MRGNYQTQQEVKAKNVIVISQGLILISLLIKTSSFSFDYITVFSCSKTFGIKMLCLSKNSYVYVIVHAVS